MIDPHKTPRTGERRGRPRWLAAGAIVLVVAGLAWLAFWLLADQSGGPSMRSLVQDRTADDAARTTESVQPEPTSRPETRKTPDPPEPPKPASRPARMIVNASPAPAARRDAPTTAESDEVYPPYSPMQGSGGLIVTLANPGAHTRVTVLAVPTSSNWEHSERGAAPDWLHDHVIKSVGNPGETFIPWCRHKQVNLTVQVDDGPVVAVTGAGVAAPGAALGRVEVRLPEPTGRALTGTVRRADASSPAGLVVRLTPGGAKRSQGKKAAPQIELPPAYERRLLIGEDGAFRFDDLPAEFRGMTLNVLEGFTPVALTTVPRIAEKTFPVPEIVVEPQDEIRVAVTFRGRAVPGVVAAVDCGKDLVREVLTGPDGTARVSIPRSTRGVGLSLVGLRELYWRGFGGAMLQGRGRHLMGFLLSAWELALTRSRSVHVSDRARGLQPLEVESGLESLLADQSVITPIRNRLTALGLGAKAHEFDYPAGLIDALAKDDIEVAMEIFINAWCDTAPVKME